MSSSDEFYKVLPDKFYELKRLFLSINPKSIDNLSIEELKELSVPLENFINEYLLPLTSGNSKEECNSDFHKNVIMPCWDTLHLRRLINQRISKFETASLPPSPPSPPSPLDLASRMMKI